MGTGRLGELWERPDAPGRKQSHKTVLSVTVDRGEIEPHDEWPPTLSCIQWNRAVVIAFLGWRVEFDARFQQIFVEGPTTQRLTIDLNTI